MLRLANILLFSFFLAFSGALMPGPLLTVTIAHAGRIGFRAGPLVILGHALPELAVVSLVVAGFGPLLKAPGVEGGISIAGGIMLIILGAGMVRAKAELPGEARAEEGAASGGRVILSGTVASIANPYWSIWWATVGLGYLLAAMGIGWFGLAAFFIGHIAADLAWYSFIAWGIGRGRGRLSPRLYHRLVTACGIFLLGFALWFLVHGATALSG